MHPPQIGRRDLIGAAMTSTVLPASGGASAQPGALANLSATAAVQAMRQGDITAESYASALLDRAKQQEGLNAFITLRPDLVLEDARAADQARSSGQALGMLHGLPIPVKDSFDTKALPTSNGTRSMREFRPQRDAGLVERLLGHGAIVMGKTNLTELSFGWTSNNGAFGPVRNPYDRRRIPGGSSGGSAAAVAARMAPLALGADTLGSIRVPASLCGLAGLRPTFGRYSNVGVLALTDVKFDQVGPLARSVADLALFDSAAAGGSIVAALPLRGVRIGIAPFYQAGLDPDVERAASAAYQRLQDAGAVIVEADIPESVKAAFDIAAAIMLYETVPSITHFLLEQGTGLSFEQMFSQVSEGMRGFLTAVALPPNRPPIETYKLMLAKREQLRDAVGHHYKEQGVSALAFPAVMGRTPEIGEEAEVEIAGERVSFFTAFGRNTALGAVAGLPSVVLPAGLSSDGLPIGLEFVGPSDTDFGLLSLGLSLEEALGPIPAPVD